MNFKITSDSVTVKITEQELKQLMSKGRLVQRMVWAGRSYSKVLEVAHIGWSFAPRADGLCVRMDPSSLYALHTMGKNKHGVSRCVGGVTLCVQVDVKHDRRVRSHKRDKTPDEA